MADIEREAVEMETLGLTLAEGKLILKKIQEGVVRARLDGKLKMKHPFYHRDDDNFVEASVVGLLEFEPGTKKIRSLQLATERATYGRVTFGVVVRSMR